MSGRARYGFGGRAGLLFLMIGLLCFSLPAAQAESPTGFKPIFNGKDLSGWKGDTNFWRVEDGAITAESTPENPCKHNTFLVWSAGEVDDFELRLQFKISGSPQANSGIQFRSQIRDDGHVMGYQADMDLAGQWMGACYDELGRGVLATRGQAATVKPGKQITHEAIGNRDELMQKIDLEGWNSYHVTAQGNEITISINDTVMSRVIDEDPEHRDLAGVLALQLHSGPPMKVQFREIQLKRLPLKDRKKIVFVAGSKSHGYFSHEHYAGCQLLAEALNRSGLPVQTVVYQDGWPSDVTAFDNADTVVCYCDGGGRHFLNPHLEAFDRVMSRGVGLVCLHYAVETVPGKEGEHFMKWMGGYFEPNYSVNPHWTANFETFPDHPISRGVQPFSINDEWYYHMRFAKDMEGVTPILSDNPPRETLNRPDGPHSGNPHVRDAVLVRKEPQHVAWAFERENDGRGFGFTGGHFHVNWQQDDFRKVVLNAIAWTAHLDVPAEGVQSPTPSVEELKQNQDYPQPDNWQFKPPVTGKKQAAAPAQSALSANQQTAAANAASASSKAIFASPVVTTKMPGHAVAIDVPIAGVKSLFLVVGDAGNGFSCDWANWAEPRLVGPDGTTRLTDLNWKAASTDWKSVRKNANVEGEPLRIDGQAVEYGIGTHANSVIEFDLPADHTFQRFQARGGIDDGGSRQQGGNASSIQFFVLTQAPGNAFLASLRQGSGGGAESRDLADAVEQLTVAKGLECRLFAGEPELLNPTNIDIDARGRIWACEVVNYRQFRNADSAEREAGDRILILEDTTGDGNADSVKTFYQGRDVDSAHGICVLSNRVLISAGDSVFWLIDDNGDDKADRKEVLFTGISGTQHDHGIHAAVFGPDGKLYFNFGNEGKQIKDKNGQPITDKQGNVVNNSRAPYQEGMVFRCNLDGSEFETLGWNFRNNWEVCVDSFGTMWQSDNDDDGNRGVRINYVMEFGNYGYRDELTGAGWREPRTNWESEIPLRHWHQNDPGSIPNLLQTGAGSPTGILLYEGALLPEVFRNQIIHCDAGPNIVRAYPVQSAGAGYTAETVNILEGTGDKWFRPSDVCVAPDGSLFVADWYDPGVGGHRMADVERGRIFRIAPPGHAYKTESIDVNTLDGAIEALKNPNLATRYLGWTALYEQGAGAEGALQDLLQHESPQLRARALWLLGKMNLAKEQKTVHLRTGLTDRDERVRVAAIRLLRQIHDEIELSDLENSISLEDLSPAVRREMLIGIRDLQPLESPLIWAELAAQHDGKDRWYLEALGIAAERQWDMCLQAWQFRVGKDWNTPAGRDIIWRSRSKQTPALLAKIISDPSTPVDELPRYFRALDFNKPLDQALLAKLAFETPSDDPARRNLIAMEALNRLSSLESLAGTQFAGAFQKLLDAQAGTSQFVTLVNRFQIEDRYPSLLEMAIEFADQQQGVDAVRSLLQKKQTSLLQQKLRTGETPQAIRLADVLGLSEEGAAVGLLLTVAKDKSLNSEVRRAAARALGRTKGGTNRLIEQAEAGQIDGVLQPVVAAALHSANWPEVRAIAAKLYPLPPSKDAEPLPSLSDLAKKTGNAQNGRLVFHTHGTCAKCHVVNTLGKDIGPDLSEIGKKLSREAMFESILYPSAGISHNYESYTLVTIDGNITNGLLVSQSDSEVSLKNAEGIIKTVSRDDIEEFVKQDVSLMPADLQKVMSLQELVDVVEYMQTLKEKK